MIQIKKGLDLSISGAPDMLVDEQLSVSHVALLGSDYQDMKPTLLVAEGDQVVLGQPLFSDKKNPTVIFTAPAPGKVVAINRGERRIFLSLVIEISGAEEKTFTKIAADRLERLSAEDVEDQLINSGLWPSLRTRPYSKIPTPGSRPAALFVSAIDTNPLSADPQVAIAEKEAEFEAGLKALRNGFDFSDAT